MLLFVETAVLYSQGTESMKEHERLENSNVERTQRKCVKHIRWKRKCR